ncbi:DUF4225 domain-containing protein [Chitinophaga costaii]|uniref:DUF4225 domain-containing protein n=1 Tax=Chitinophaga costaii TaxID=1335309 RepID=UPI0013FE10ED|nr:DUF4225 domain-containing protein [Chitinophaga costaii]
MSGNRISKTVNGVLTWYVRDATGNVMSIYTRGDNSVNTGHLTQIETDIYGSSRLGIDESKKDLEEAGATDNGVLFNFQRGEKVYELGNHLGNVLSTIGDAKLPGSSNGNEVVDYTRKVQSAGDYYPFGMQEPGRTFSSVRYRYGFNGQEKSDEIKGEGNSYTAEFWEYDPGIGRRWSLDPKPMIGVSEYAAFNSSPIQFSDPLGDTSKPSTAPIRIMGALNAVAGGGEIIAGATFGVTTSWTGLGAVVGGAGVVHGLDVAAAGLTQLASGKETKSYTRQAIASGLSYAGVSDNKADVIASYVDIGLSMALSARSSIPKDATFVVSRPAVQVVKAETQAAKTGLANPQLVQKSATLAERAIGGTGGVAGTAKHQYASKLLNRYQSIYGNRGLETGLYFNKGVGNRGFLDVIDYTNGIIYDFKFGKAVMSPAQYNKYFNNFGLPIQVIRP